MRKKKGNIHLSSEVLYKIEVAANRYDLLYLEGFPSSSLLIPTEDKYELGIKRLYMKNKDIKIIVLLNPFFIFKSIHFFF